MLFIGYQHEVPIKLVELGESSYMMLGDSVIIDSSRTATRRSSSSGVTTNRTTSNHLNTNNTSNTNTTSTSNITSTTSNNNKHQHGKYMKDNLIQDQSKTIRNASTNHINYNSSIQLLDSYLNISHSDINHKQQQQQQQISLMKSQFDFNNLTQRY